MPYGQYAKLSDRRDRAFVFLDKETTEKIDRLKGETKKTSRIGVIKELVDEHYSKQELYPVATYERVMVTTEEIPVCLCGLARSGKSITLREGILKRCQKEGIPFILVDTVVEHSNLDAEMIMPSQVGGLKFTGHGSYRVVTTNRNPALVKTEIRFMFEFLNSIKHEGNLKRWVVALDESHRYSSPGPIYDFVAEGGKWTRKTIVVASNPSLWRNVTTPLRPDPAIVDAYVKTAIPAVVTRP